MDKELKFGPMGLYTKVLGETVKRTVKEGNAIYRKKNIFIVSKY